MTGLNSTLTTQHGDEVGSYDDKPSVVLTGTDGTLFDADNPLTVRAKWTQDATQHGDVTTALAEALDLLGQIRDAALGGTLQASDIIVDDSGFTALSGADVQAVLAAADVLFAAGGGGGAAPFVLTPAKTETSPSWDSDGYYTKLMGNVLAGAGTVLAGMSGTYTSPGGLHVVDIAGPVARCYRYGTVTVDATGGTYDLTVNGATVTIAWNASASDIFDAVKWLPAVNEAVEVHPPASGVTKIDWATLIAPTVSIDDSALTGGAGTAVYDDTEGPVAAGILVAFLGATNMLLGPYPLPISLVDQPFTARVYTDLPTGDLTMIMAIGGLGGSSTVTVRDPAGEDGGTYPHGDHLAVTVAPVPT